MMLNKVSGLWNQRSTKLHHLLSIVNQLPYTCFNFWACGLLLIHPTHSQMFSNMWVPTHTGVIPAGSGTHKQDSLAQSCHSQLIICGTLMTL